MIFVSSSSPRFFSRFLRFFLVALMLWLSSCASQKSFHQSDGVDGDTIDTAFQGEDGEGEDIPLANRQDGTNFLGENVDRHEFSPLYFAFDSNSIGADQQEKVVRVAKELKRSRAHVILAGFTDDRGTEEYNRSLGERRALEVRRALITQGVSANSIQTVSFGKELPADSGENEAAWAKNRRVEFGIVRH